MKLLTLEEYIKNAQDEYGWKMVETEVLNLLKISDDSFSCETPLGMTFTEFNQLSRIDEDLFTYDIEGPKPTYIPCVVQQTGNQSKKVLENYEWKMSYEECEKIYVEAVIFIDKRLVRLIDVTVEQWLDLKYGNYEKMDENVKKGFAEWLASKFYNHMTMDWYTKNTLWIHWMRGGDELELTDEELSNPEDKDLTGYMTYFQDYEWYDNLIEGKLKEKALKQKAIYEESWGNATQGVMEFCAWLKRCF
ncbi:hypothetical protein Tco_1393270 [Tanacetum coccineum]